MMDASRIQWALSHAKENECEQLKKLVSRVNLVLDAISVSINIFKSYKNGALFLEFHSKVVKI